MINYRGVTYLFYSANWFGVLDSTGRSNYADGYAICPSGPLAPCTRPTPADAAARQQRHGTGSWRRLGLYRHRGRLRLAYHSYWLNENRNGFHPRRLQIATIVQNPDRTLRRG